MQKEKALIAKMREEGRSQCELDLAKDGLRFRAMYAAAIEKTDLTEELDDIVARHLCKDPETLDEVRVVIDAFMTERELRDHA